MEHGLLEVNYPTDNKFFLVFGTTNNFLSFRSLCLVFSLVSPICEILKASQFPTKIASCPLYGITWDILPGAFVIRVVAPEST